MPRVMCRIAVSRLARLGSYDHRDVAIIQLGCVAFLNYFSRLFGLAVEREALGVFIPRK